MSDFDDIDIPVEDEQIDSAIESNEVIEPTILPPLKGKVYGFDELIEKLSNEIDISNRDYSNEKVATSVQRTILSHLLEILPTAFESYKKKPTQGQALALKSLIEQATSGFQQIRSSENLENQIEYIQNEIIEPMIKMFINLLYDSIFFCKKALKQDKAFITDSNFDIISKHLDGIIKTIGQKLDEEEEKQVKKLEHYFLEV